MLTFEEKLAIIESFPQLTKKKVSLGRYNFHFDASMHEKKTVVSHLHPNGNGFVYAGHLPKKATDEKGMVNIRDYSAEQLRALIAASIDYLSQPPVQKTEQTSAEAAVSEEQRWVDREHHTLLLVHEDDLWNVYAGHNLDASFESQKEAIEYLQEEGFRPE